MIGWVYKKRGCCTYSLSLLQPHHRSTPFVDAVPGADEATLVQPPRARPRSTQPLTLAQYQSTAPDPILPDEAAFDPDEPVSLATYQAELGDLDAQPSSSSGHPSPSQRAMTFEDYKQAIPQAELEETRHQVVEQSLEKPSKSRKMSEGAGTSRTGSLGSRAGSSSIFNWFEPWKTGSTMTFEDYKKTKQGSKKSFGGDDDDDDDDDDEGDVEGNVEAAARGDWDAPEKKKDDKKEDDDDK